MCISYVYCSNTYVIRIPYSGVYVRLEICMVFVKSYIMKKIHLFPLSALLFSMLWVNFMGAYNNAKQKHPGCKKGARPIRQHCNK